uniref:Uncharacterized protein n=1 Tax=Pyrodinium bahamense TaxID=73915 RepID=A0A7S0F7W8_9DINO|mmetsp:Transcript_10609/g.29421  ORF Transcript_10609/g.29421 Transcript_10609/m.29421 type:complete len:288 (+) Transcript_10609:119-982(+)
MVSAATLDHSHIWRSGMTAHSHGAGFPALGHAGRILGPLASSSSMKLQWSAYGDLTRKARPLQLNLQGSFLDHPGSRQQPTAEEEYQAQLAEWERQKAVLKQQIQMEDQKYNQERGVEATNVAQEKMLDANVGGSAVLTEEQEQLMRDVQGAQVGQEEAIGGEEEAVAEKLRLMRELEKLNSPELMGFRPRIPMVSAEDEPPVTPANELRIKLPPSLKIAQVLQRAQPFGPVIDMHPAKTLPHLALPDEGGTIENQMPPLLVFVPGADPASALNASHQRSPLGSDFL